MRLTFAPKLMPGLLLLLLFGAAPPATAQVFAARVDPADLGRVLVVRGDTIETTELRRFDGSVIETAPSPSGLWVGSLVVHKPDRAGGPRVFRLHVLDEDGGTVRVIDHVRRFVFSPEDNYVAVIRGNGYEGGPGFFPSSTEIIGLTRLDVGPIPGFETATDMDWARFDDKGLVLLARVFEGETSILEYVLDTNTVIPTFYRGLHFSPDGRYYYLEPAESLQAGLCEAGHPHDSCVRVFEREGWQPLRLGLNPKLRRPIGWADGANILIANERSHDTQLFDVNTAESQESVSAIDWRWSARPGFVVNRSGDEPNFRELGKPNVRSIKQ